MSDEDHDILIEIRTKVGIFTDAFQKHCDDDTRRETTINNSLKAAHKRIDRMFLSGIGAIVILAVTIWIR